MKNKIIAMTAIVLAVLSFLTPAVSANYTAKYQTEDIAPAVVDVSATGMVEEM